ncbi:MAG: hypothetical protein EP330_08780 [Deltaproteobacteria bacterium]|nr:MAG: hypothetical protein EP330_08780 [Deltaproteobacteria bacterium]
MNPLNLPPTLEATADMDAVRVPIRAGRTFPAYITIALVAGVAIAAASYALEGPLHGLPAWIPTAIGVFFALRVPVWLGRDTREIALHPTHLEFVGEARIPWSEVRNIQTYDHGPLVVIGLEGKKSMNLLVRGDATDARALAELMGEMRDRVRNGQVPEGLTRLVDGVSPARPRAAQPASASAEPRRDR